MQVRKLEFNADYVARYNYTAKFSKSRWAWEFLRRNPEFFAEAIAHQTDMVRSRDRCRGIVTLHQMAPCPDAEKWGLVYFPNPEKTALTANTFWSSRQYPRRLTVHVAACEPGVVDTIFESTTAKCKVIHLRDASGHEHLLLRGAGCVIQVRCTGMSLHSKEPHEMKLVIEGMLNPRAMGAALERASVIFGDDDDEPPKWTTVSERLRNALLAIDAEDAGLTLFQTAELLYGADKAADGWAFSRAMKDTVRRLRKKGNRLRAGGYLKLVKADD